MNLKIGNVKGATDYKVEKSLNGKTYTSLENLPGPGTLAVSGHEIGKTYYYRVKTCNSNGTCSKWTVVSKKQTTRVPDFSLETTSKNVMITITAVQEADGYEIYRSTSKNGKYTLVKSLTDLTYNNKTKKGTKYYYKVRSYKTVSGKKVYSSYTKVQNIKSK